MSMNWLYQLWKIKQLINNELVVPVAEIVLKLWYKNQHIFVVGGLDFYIVIIIWI